MKTLLAFFRNLFSFLRHADDFIAADQEQYDRIIHDPEATASVSGTTDIPVRC